MKDSAKEDSSGSANRITSSTVIIGNIKSDSDFRMDGKLEGNITVNGRLITGKSANIKGNINCNSADISGKVFGNIISKNQLYLRADSYMEGEVEVGKIIVEEGAKFNASCKMKTSSSENSTKSVK